ncbi:MAG: DUF2892 domain-containing protein [Micavibrio sp.]|nr:DUF2892 domain-containing protein [Micavibrio sp.]
MTAQKRIQKNLANWDRAARVVAGLALLLYWALSGNMGWWMPIVGTALLVNAAMGTCGLYALLGISTCPIKHPPKTSGTKADE